MKLAPAKVQAASVTRVAPKASTGRFGTTVKKTVPARPVVSAPRKTTVKASTPARKTKKKTAVKPATRAAKVPPKKIAQATD